MLAWAELWYSSSYHHSLGTTPFHFVCSLEPLELLDYRMDDSLVEVVDVVLTRRQEVIKVIRCHLKAV